MKQQYTGQEWTKNRPIYFQIGVIVALLVANHIINIETNISTHNIYPITSTIDDTEPLVSFTLSTPTPPKPPSLFIEPVDEIPSYEPEIIDLMPERIESTQSNFENNTAPLIANRNPLPLPEYEDNTEEITVSPFILNPERMPLFKDCVESEDSYAGQLACTKQKIQKTIRKYLRYPALAKENNMEGTVVCSFIISASGQITDIKIERTKGLGMDEAVVKVIKKLPNFIPGEQNSRQVNVKMYLPIKFKLDN